MPESGAFIVAANHRSLADPPLIGVSSQRPVHFLAKEELFRFRPFGWLISNLNAHPLKRASHDVKALKAAKEILGSGDPIILFPEGRRSKTDTLQPAKAGVGMLSSLTGAPVIPAYIHNSGYLKEFRRLSVLFGAPLYPQNFDSYQAMADATMLEISKLQKHLQEGGAPS